MEGREPANAPRSVIGLSRPASCSAARTAGGSLSPHPAQRISGIAVSGGRWLEVNGQAKGRVGDRIVVWATGSPGINGRERNIARPQRPARRSPPRVGVGQRYVCRAR